MFLYETFDKTLSFIYKKLKIILYNLLILVNNIKNYIYIQFIKFIILKLKFIINISNF